MAPVFKFWSATCMFIMLCSHATSTCEEGKSSRGRSEDCCDGEAYILGDENRTILAACNIEPENASLSYADSLWTAYECIVRKGVGAHQVDLKAYIDMMSSNLSESKRERIREVVLKNSFSKNSSLETGFAKLESYRTEYFKAEFEVCKYEGQQTMEFSQNETKETQEERWLVEWEPDTTCVGRKVPKFLVKYFPNRQKNTMWACEADFQKRYNTSWNNPLFYHMFGLCFYASIEAISVQYVESDDFSFNHVFYNALPKYWSKGVKESGYANILKSISESYPVNTQINDVSSAVSAIRSKFQKMLPNVATGSGDQTGTKYFAEKAYITNAITGAGIKALGQFCPPYDAAADATRLS